MMKFQIDKLNGLVMDESSLCAYLIEESAKWDRGTRKAHITEERYLEFDTDVTIAEISRATSCARSDAFTESS